MIKLDAHGPERTQVWEDPSGMGRLSHQSHHPLGLCFSVTRHKISLSACQLEKQVFLVLGVLESGKGEAGTAQGGPPTRDPEVSSETGT